MQGLNKLLGAVQLFSQDRDVGAASELLIGGNRISDFFEIIENRDTSAVGCRCAHCETPIIEGLPIHECFRKIAFPKPCCDVIEQSRSLRLRTISRPRSNRLQSSIPVVLPALVPAFRTVHLNSGSFGCGANRTRSVQLAPRSCRRLLTSR